MKISLKEKDPVTEREARDAYKAMLKDDEYVGRTITPDGYSRERGLGPGLAASRLRAASAEGKWASPGYGDQGQFLKKGGTVKDNKAQELRHASTLRKIAFEESAEAAKMKCGGKVKKMARGGGIEIRGKTRGKIV
jgi:hypothetical protein